MCGIAGWINPVEGVQQAVLEEMAARIRHRGPDAQGISIQGPCGLVHRRLSILDLSPAGAQPMASADGRHVLVFNGEIFNFQSLRAELESMGERFTGTSDTEVILRGFVRWGDAVIPRLEGMFALACWDTQARRMTAATDRLGKKPFFYHVRGPRLAFTSELRALLHVPGVGRDIDASAFATYAAFGYNWGEQCILQGVKRLPAGHRMTWQDGAISCGPYASILDEPLPEPRSDPAGCESRLDELISSATRRRLVSDVPLGCFLSGGVDSSLISAYAAKHASSPLRTFTVSFSDSANDEGPFAAAIAAHLGTRHTTLPATARDMLQSFTDILATCPEPLADDSYLPTYLISRETRRHVTVVLSGDGGDEFFWGYPKYFQSGTAARAHSMGGWLWPLISWLPWPDTQAKALQLFSQPDDAAREQWLASLWKQPELPGILARPDGPAEAGRRFRDVWQRHASLPACERFSRTDLATYLEGDILMKVDRASMAVGLEVRSPLLDETVTRAALSMRRRHPSLFQGKAVLRNLLAKHVPREMFERPKRGFSPPMDAWYRGPLREVLMEYTSNSRLKGCPLWNPAGIEAARSAHLEGGRNFGRKLHAVVAFEIWRESLARY